MLHQLFSLCGKLFAKGKLNILIYHQVPKTHDPLRFAEPDEQAFRWQMALIAKHYTPISLSEALSRLSDDSLPANAICVTFDDGYLNNLEVAAPILSEFNIPATVFVATAFISGRNMWNDRLIDICGDQTRKQLDLKILDLPTAMFHNMDDRKRVAFDLISRIKYRPYQERQQLIDQLYADNEQAEFEPKMMSETQLKELSDMGIEIGAHTVEHPILKTLSKENQHQQIKQSKLALENILEKPVRTFAYPNGKYQSDYDDVSREAVIENNFELAVSTNWGVSSKRTDRYQLNRFTPWDKTPFKFHLRLLRNALSI